MVLLLTRHDQLQYGDEERFARRCTSFNMVRLTSPEDYDAELERMNNAMMAENQALQHDNKQLNTLIKEYETTLETVMSLFRQRAVRFPFISSCVRWRSRIILSHGAPSQVESICSY
jgi:hypothetical protein